MNILTIPKIILTPRDGWREMERMRPSLQRLLSSIVLPLSLLPPFFIHHAGAHHGAALGEQPWTAIATLVYAAEVVTFLGMGWLLREVAATYRVPLPSRDAYLLAAIAPMPFWLASLTLLKPGIALNATALLLALAASCLLVYQGLVILGRIREEILAAAITQAVMGAALTLWTLPLLALTLMLMGI